VVQVVISKKGNSSQSSLMSFAYAATPSGKESLQSFRVVVAIFSASGYIIGCRSGDYRRKGSVVGVGIVVCRLVRV